MAVFSQLEDVGRLGALSGGPERDAQYWPTWSPGSNGELAAETHPNSANCVCILLLTGKNRRISDPGGCSQHVFSREPDLDPSQVFKKFPGAEKHDDPMV